jgi:hypothetical protein
LKQGLFKIRRKVLDDELEPTDYFEEGFDVDEFVENYNDEEEN